MKEVVVLVTALALVRAPALAHVLVLVIVQDVLVADAHALALVPALVLVQVRIQQVAMKKNN